MARNALNSAQTGGLLIAALAVCFAVPRPARGQDVDLSAVLSVIEQSVVKAIEEAEPSVVAIARYRPVPTGRQQFQFDPFHLDDPPQNSDPSLDLIPNEFGTGIVIAPEKKRNERFILTNYHVVRGGPTSEENGNRAADRLYVRFANRRGFYAQIYAADPRSDLAVLKVDFDALQMKPADVKPIRFGDGGSVKKGQFVLVLGNPYAIARDGSVSASWGMISNISRAAYPVEPRTDPEALKKQTIHQFGTLLQIDARLNLGTSGGALINRNGELIGITTSLAALEGYEKSAGYAIPINDATRRIIETLMRGHEVEYGFLGVEPQDVDPNQLRRYASDFAQSTAATIRVLPRSPADTGGLATGDLILSVNETPIRGRDDLMREIGLLAPGTTARIRVWRPDIRRELTVLVNLGKWPARDEDGIVAANWRHPPWRGLFVDYPTGRAKYISDPIYHPAVVITQVVPETPAADAELTEGDFITHVNETAVETPAEFYDAIKDLRNEARLRLLNGREVVVRK